MSKPSVDIERSGQLEDTALILVGGVSRSGTTLLSSVLDAHPQISAGAELIPSPVTDLRLLGRLLQKSLASSDDFSLAGRRVRIDGEPVLGSILTRCYRAGIVADDVFKTIDRFLNHRRSSIIQFLDRLSFAVDLIARRVNREGTRFGSFKLNSPSVLPVLENYPNAYLLCMVRHPLDVIDSHLRNNFGKTPVEICKAWRNYGNAFGKALKLSPNRTNVLRYEDLVERPEKYLEIAFQMLPIEFSDRILRFHETDSNILKSRHPNTAQLRRGFFTDSVNIARGNKTLEKVVTSECSGLMRFWEYE